MEREFGEDGYYDMATSPSYRNTDMSNTTGSSSTRITIYIK